MLQAAFCIKEIGSRVFQHHQLFYSKGNWIACTTVQRFHLLLKENKAGRYNNKKIYLLKEGIYGDKISFCGKELSAEFLL